MAWFVVLGFGAALASEVLAWSQQPEKLWYEGRALAESAKTLAWRYAVGAEPFPTNLDPEKARELLRSRLQEVSAGSPNEVTIVTEDAIVTSAMGALRREPFVVRRSTYLEGRTLDQQRWYATKAARNQKAATGWRIFLVLAEIMALVLATMALVPGSQGIDFAGLLAAVVASGAAWVAVKQYAPLAAAYSMAARELAIQADRLRQVPESEWPTVAGDAEEAISREHTLWVASRTGTRSFK